MSKHHYRTSTIDRGVGGDVIDLRDYQVSLFSNDLAHATNTTPFLRYQELRARRIRENGWCDLDDLGRDRDGYDDPQSQTTTVVLHRENNSVLAGVRCTNVLGDLADALSVQMWDPKDQEVILSHSHLQQLFTSGRVVDMTRLFLDHSGTIEQVVIAMGACFRASSQQIGGFCTLDSATYRLLRFAGLPGTEVHRAELGGRQTVFVALTPELLSHAFEGKAGPSLRVGAELVDMQSLPPSVPTPETK